MLFVIVKCLQFDPTSKEVNSLAFSLGALCHFTPQSSQVASNTHTHTGAHALSSVFLFLSLGFSKRGNKIGFKRFSPSSSIEVPDWFRKYNRTQDVCSC
jgi:hypothetical protein